MPYQPDNPPHVFSVLAGREVSTWSGEWKHECEVRFLAGLPLVIGTARSTGKRTASAA
ncbi:DUF7696 family protein [Bosea sp. RAF48]|uniref:DUF7696 family protein n=1 Tax=Bosea sp. RAF48 TaxID=3237480 RepID=UPI003F8FFAF0